jgi:2-dehydropantoate 2-reductase
VASRRYIVVGAGAVGGAMAGLLQLSGAPVIVVARGAQLEALQRGPLRLETPSRLERVEFEVVDAPSRVTMGARDVLLLCTKTQDVDDALRAVVAVAPPALPVICAQNGVSAERIAVARCQRVYGMVVFAPASHLEPGRVTLHSEPVLGVLDIGVHPTGVDPLVEGVVADLRRAGFDARAEPNILRLKYGKLLTNVGNALQALAGNAALPLARAIQDEAVAAYRAAGIDYAPLEELADRYRDVRELPVAGASRGGGSTWQSLARRAGSIETDYLNGEIVRLGEASGVPTPKNRVLVELARRAVAERWPPAHLGVSDLAALLS